MTNVERQTVPGRPRTIGKKQRRSFSKLDRKSTVTAPPPVTERKELRYAGFWMRLWAFLLDMVVIFSINGLLVYPLFRGLDLQFTVVGFSGEVVLAGMIGYVYYLIMTKQYGQTVGKMVFGLKVVNKHGEKLTWMEALFREGVGRFLHHVFFLFYLLYLVVAFTGKKQGIHDFIADTYVIHEA
ncbi:RDD family protein [Halalkalibacterium ligniniphilum]|uniref:RDD family protein n=1 Tax=Halalkalibacterium ligniniphilum TaxID=1134413 RepID=UPI000346D4B6|nr:RDD family protein [Halalkalibacterium ligniniphilum]